MKDVIISIVLLIILPMWASCQKSQSELTADDPLTAEDFQITRTDCNFGIKLEQPYSEVRKILGEPSKVIVTTNESDQKWDTLTYYYPGLILDVFRYWAQIKYIMFEGEGYSTTRGAKSGDSEKDVIDLYGEPNRVENLLAYNLEMSKEMDKYYILFFTIIDGKVSKITMHIAED